MFRKGCLFGLIDIWLMATRMKTGAEDTGAFMARAFTEHMFVSLVCGYQNLSGIQTDHHHDHHLHFLHCYQSFLGHLRYG